MSGPYTVRVVGGGEPTVTHSTYQTAAARAIQLARQTHKQVMVFQAIELYTPELPTTEQIPVRMEKL